MIPGRVLGVAGSLLHLKLEMIIQDISFVTHNYITDTEKLVYWQRLVN